MYCYRWIQTFRSSRYVNCSTEPMYMVISHDPFPISPQGGGERECKFAYLKFRTPHPLPLSLIRCPRILQPSLSHPGQILALSFSLPCIVLWFYLSLVQVQYFIYCTEMSLFLWISFSWSCPGCSLPLHTSLKQASWKRPCVNAQNICIDVNSTNFGKVPLYNLDVNFT